MKKIPLTQGKSALVDDEDYWLVSQHKWYAMLHRYTWYAVTTITLAPNKHTTLQMHRLLAGFPPFLIDHKNRDGLDNRRRNLRPATNSENGANARIPAHNTSGYRGVCWDRRNKKWMVHIKCRGVQKKLGRFLLLRDAAAARKQAEKKIFGEFAPV